MGGCGAKTPNRVSYAEFVGAERQGETRILRHTDYKNEFLRTPEPEITTLYLTQSLAFKRYGPRPFLGTVVDGVYVFKTYNQIREEAVAAGSALSDLVEETTDDGRVYRFFGIYSANREEWVTASIASTHYSLISVPLYDSLGTEALEYILNQTGMRVVLCASASTPKLFKQRQEGKSGRLSVIVQFEAITAAQEEEARRLGLRIVSWSNLLATGRTSQKPLRPPRPQDVFTISYTSGTTGFPKGAILTHASMIASLSGIQTAIQVNTNDVHLSFLPLAHIYERIVEETIIYNGGSIGFWRGNILTIRDDLALLMPTLLPGVPRLFNRFFDVVKARFAEATGLKRSLINKAIASKLEALRAEGKLTSGLYDSLVFNKVKAVLGGRVRIATTASAPISSDVLEFLKICFCCPIVEAYGQTETCGAVTLTKPQDPEVNHVGGPCPGVEIKLQDIPEMNYTTKTRDKNMNLTPCGEICYRGPIIFSGYYKQPDKTAEAIDEEGWLHSGDVGMLLGNGAIRIIDRKKNIFKLAQGEYVAPEKIENLLIQLPEIQQVFVYGDSLEAHLVAIVVPAEPQIRDLAQAVGVTGDLATLCTNPKVTAKVLENINGISRSGGLFGFEIPKAIMLHPVPFSIENNLLTPTMKLKRFDAKMFFQEQLRRLYNK